MLMIMITFTHINLMIRDKITLSKDFKKATSLPFFDVRLKGTWVVLDNSCRKGYGIDLDIDI